ncbi:hypothetical protein MBLNU13_g11576t1 [Cladosporium sp. NU13]
MDGYFGHSNDSLFASADEMAGHYTPHTNHHGFTPTCNSGNTPSHQPASRPSTGHRSIRSTDSDDMELNYPMPDEMEIWRQAEHPDSINKLLNATGDMCQETFRGAAQILSHANPETFEMPLEARFICMKVDRETDMRYCLANGAVTNLPKCNERINAVWRERDGQRVFMMFSISGMKEFCAMAEMTGPVQKGSMPGWSKPGCEDLVLLTFIYVKNVPFSLINHIKNKSNRQPVANMWNSMMYHNNTGYHVARVYCEHPVLSSVLVKIQTETQVGYKSQLRIPTSGNTVYSASSFGPNNDKSHDPRSAIKPHIYRSGNHGAKSTASWWRSNGIPPTPSRQPDPFFNPGPYATPTPVASHQYGMHQQHMTGATQPPPPFMLPNSDSGGFNDARSFTTADERMIADFAHSRDAKRSEANLKVPSGPQQVEADPFGGARTSHNGQTRHSSAMKPDRHGQGHDVYVGRSQANSDAQWQGHGCVTPTPVYTDSAAGFGNAPGATGPYNHQGQHPFYATRAMPPQLPSLVTSSNVPHHGLTQAREIRRQQSQGFALRSPPSYNTMKSRRNHAHPVPHPVQNTFNNPRRGGQKQIPRSGSPMKHSQSMPVMQLTHQFAAQHIHASNTDAKADIENTVADWIDKTPRRDNFALAKQPSGPDFDSKALTDLGDILGNPPRSAGLAEKVEWHQSMAGRLEAEIKLIKASGNFQSKGQEAQLDYHQHSVKVYKITLDATYRDHQDARGDLADPTVNYPPTSPGTPHNSDDWPKKAYDSTVESDLIAPETDEHKKIHRSVSKNREGKAAYISEKIPRRRGDVREFSPAFNERSTATTEEPVNAYSSNSRPALTHGHPPKRTVVRPTYDQHDSCAEDQQCNEVGCYHYEYSHDDNVSDFASQAGAPEDDGEVFSPRGRGYQYQHAHPGRYASRMSYNGGMGLWYGPQQK